MESNTQVIATEIIKKLANAGYIAYFAGGFVRDLLLGISSDEIDIATNASPDAVMALFPKTIAVGIAFGVVIVVIDGINFEVTTFRKDLNYQDGRHPEGVDFSTPEEDAKRRDFTINGMFYDPLSQQVFDFVGGKKDLEKKIVRSIGNPEERFQEDRLRMVRAFRFASRFGFEIDNETINAIKKFAPSLFPAVSMERINQELTKMSTFPRFDEALNEMQKVGLLSVIFPDFKSKEIKFPKFPPYTPLIVYLLELFPQYSLEQKIALCQYLKMSNRDMKLVSFFHEAENLFIHSTNDRYDWAKFYSHPLSALFLSVKEASSPSKEFALQHKNRKEQLYVHIKRLEENRPLITATLLQAQGIAPGKTMGFLLKEGEKMVINEDIHNEVVAIDRLKKSPLWPK